MSRCFQDQCAWWDVNNQCCAILTLAEKLTPLDEPRGPKE